MTISNFIYIINYIFNKDIKLIMKLYYSNINQINEDVESFVIAKSKIERIMIKEGKIDKKLSIKDFLSTINILNIFISSKTETLGTVAFNIFKNDEFNEIIILYSSDNEIAEKEFKEIMPIIDYNINNLKHYDITSAIDKLEGKSYFIINNEFYSI